MDKAKAKKRGAKQPPVVTCEMAIKVIKLLPPKERDRFDRWVEGWLKGGKVR